MDPILGQIMIFAGSVVPRGWAVCNGQLLPIAQNEALFSLLGTSYGGDGVTNFALPNLNGNIPVGMGPNRRLGSSEPLDGTEGGAQQYQTVALNYMIAIEGIYGESQPKE